MIFLQIGSNIGDRFSNLMTCIKNIELLIGKIINKSKIYVSECWGVKNQRDYFNMVVAIKSIYDATKVLKIISIIENDMGRESTFRYGPRLIDIDIIFFNNYEVNQDNLTIPHYDWKNRLFVIEPLYEVLELELNKSEYKINGQKVKRVGNINL